MDKIGLPQECLFFFCFKRFFLLKIPEMFNLNIYLPIRILSTTHYSVLVPSWSFPLFENLIQVMEFTNFIKWLYKARSEFIY